MSWLLIIVPLLIAGCTSSTSSPSKNAAADEDTIKANLAKLDPADRKLAEEQKFCAVETENRLGSMNAPIKVEINGEPVFLCCKSCKTTADDKTKQAEVLAKAKELRAQNGEK
jgi:hypothetical protein